MPKVKSSYRSSLVFLIGLLLTAGIAMGYDRYGWVLITQGRAEINASDTRHLPRAPQALTDADTQAAKVAWQYILQNTQVKTGFVDAVAGYPSGTLWDQGSYLMGLLSAHKLGLVDAAEFHSRVDQFLASLAALPLVNAQLPNKAYDTRSLQMVDYQNIATEAGIGWSALDIARMLMAMRVLERVRPEYGLKIRNILSRWDLSVMARDGMLWGAKPAAEGFETLQEGRIGYEQYAARAAALWGLDTLQASSASGVINWQRVAGVDVPIDQRSADVFGAITPTLSEPYILLGLELGFDSETRVLADRVYRAQEGRYREAGQKTMVSEDHIDQAPHFLYASVYGNGQSWATLTEDGEHHPELRSISLKAVMGWDALYGTDYTQMLRDDLLDLASDHGWAAGRYELDARVNDIHTLNTNAIVLEAIHYKAFGPLWQTR